MKMDTIKDRNRMDLQEKEDIKKRWQDYIELYKKYLNDPDNHDGVITHLEPDNSEYKIKRALGSITTNKASGGDGIPSELFQILIGDAAKALHAICQQIWKTQQWSQDWERSVFISIPKKGNAKECSNYHTITHISHASKVRLKILQARLQQYNNLERQFLGRLIRSPGSLRKREGSGIFKEEERTNVFFFPPSTFSTFFVFFKPRIDDYTTNNSF